MFLDLLGKATDEEKDDKEDESMEVNIDKLDYILASMITRRNVPLPRPKIDITPRVEKPKIVKSPKVVKSSKVTKKKIASPIKRRGGKKYKKTIKKRK